jgi:hypothetical protein
MSATRHGAREQSAKGGLRAVVASGFNPGNGALGPSPSPGWGEMPADLALDLIPGMRGAPLLLIRSNRDEIA